MTREQMNATILASKNREFLDEVENQLDIEREYPYDAVCAALDVEDLAEDWLSKGSSSDVRALLRAAREALIAIGFYRVMPDDEIANTFTGSGRSPWAFKVKGVAYTSDHTIDEFFDGAIE